MPLLDHFRSPLADLRHWESFHAAWATEIMRTLNRQVLPAGCFAETQVHLGGRVEIDVATFEHGHSSSAPADGNSGGVAVETWAPPQAALVIPTVFPDEIEVQVFRTSGGATLVGAIALVSPGNKDRPESRRAFAAKCASYLQQGIGLVIVDVVTEWQANLHAELLGLMGPPGGSTGIADETSLYTVAYRPRRLQGSDQVEIWPVPLTLGGPLPMMPLALRGVATVPLDLDGTYAATCHDSRL